MTVARSTMPPGEPVEPQPGRGAVRGCGGGPRCEVCRIRRAETVCAECHMLLCGEHDALLRPRIVMTSTGSSAGGVLRRGGTPPTSRPRRGRRRVAVRRHGPVEATTQDASPGPVRVRRRRAGTHRARRPRRARRWSERPAPAVEAFRAPAALLTRSRGGVTTGTASTRTRGTFARNACPGTGGSTLRSRRRSWRCCSGS